MAVNVFKSDLAIAASIMIVWVFVRLKRIAHQHSDLQRRVEILEKRVAKGFTAHVEELQQIRLLLARLEQPPDAKRGRIGF